MSKIEAFTIARLAHGAYQAYRKMARDVGEESLAGPPQTWHELDPRVQQCWIAVATQLWAEMTALHIGIRS